MSDGDARWVRRPASDPGSVECDLGGDGERTEERQGTDGKKRQMFGIEKKSGKLMGNASMGEFHLPLQNCFSSKILFRKEPRKMKLKLNKIE